MVDLAELDIDGKGRKPCSSGLKVAPLGTHTEGPLAIGCTLVKTFFAFFV